MRHAGRRNYRGLAAETVVSPAEGNTGADAGAEADGGLDDIAREAGNAQGTSGLDTGDHTEAESIVNAAVGSVPEAGDREWAKTRLVTQLRGQLGLRAKAIQEREQNAVSGAALLLSRVTRLGLKRVQDTAPGLRPVPTQKKPRPTRWIRPSGQRDLL